MSPLNLAGIFAGAVVAILVTRSKSPGNVAVTEIDADGSARSYEIAPEISDATIDNPAPIIGAASEVIKDIVASVPAFVFGTKYDKLIYDSAKANGIDPWVLYRLLWTESHFREDIISGKVRSSAGAMGIAQFVPATAREVLGSEAAALDPAQAIPGAARYLARLIKATGSVAAGVAAYNWGIGNVQRLGLDKAPHETQQYVASILPGTSIG